MRELDAQRPCGVRQILCVIPGIPVPKTASFNLAQKPLHIILTTSINRPKVSTTFDLLISVIIALIHRCDLTMEWQKCEHDLGISDIFVILVTEGNFR